VWLIHLTTVESLPPVRVMDIVSLHNAGISPEEIVREAAIYLTSCDPFHPARAARKKLTVRSTRSATPGMALGAFSTDGIAQEFSSKVP